MDRDKSADEATSSSTPPGLSWDKAYQISHAFAFSFPFRYAFLRQSKSRHDEDLATEYLQHAFYVIFRFSRRLDRFLGPRGHRILSREYCSQGTDVELWVDEWADIVVGLLAVNSKMERCEDRSVQEQYVAELQRGLDAMTVSIRRWEEQRNLHIPDDKGLDTQDDIAFTKAKQQEAATSLTDSEGEQKSIQAKSEMSVRPKPRNANFIFLPCTVHGISFIVIVERQDLTLSPFFKYIDIAYSARSRSLPPKPTTMSRRRRLRKWRSIDEESVPLVYTDPDGCCSTCAISDAEDGSLDVELVMSPRPPHATILRPMSMSHLNVLRGNAAAKKKKKEKDIKAGQAASRSITRTRYLGTDVWDAATAQRGWLEWIELEEMPA